MSPNIKEWIQYCTAVAMIISGMILAFLSFFLNHFDIANGVLLYIAQALVYAGGIFGVSLYFKTRMGELESKASTQKDDMVNAIMQFLQDKIGNKINTEYNENKD